jgi:hypothetical protein
MKMKIFSAGESCAVIAGAVLYDVLRGYVEACVCGCTQLVKIQMKMKISGLSAPENHVRS